MGNRVYSQKQNKIQIQVYLIKDRLQTQRKEIVPEKYYYKIIIVRVVVLEGYTTKKRNIDGTESSWYT